MLLRPRQHFLPRFTLVMLGFFAKHMSHSDRFLLGSQFPRKGQNVVRVRAVVFVNQLAQP